MLHSIRKLDRCVRMSIQIMISHQMNVESHVFISARLSVSFNQLLVQLHLEEFQFFDEIRLREISALKIRQLIHEKPERFQVNLRR